MARYEHSIEVNVSLRTAYNQWTQFEEFPFFMEGVKSVEQRTDTMLHWAAEIAGRTEEWDAEITDQRPDNRIAWQSISGAKHSGLVTFHYMATDKTLIMLVVDYDPEGFIENVGSALGIVQRRIAGDLQRFKTYIESRGHESGGWRGEVDPYEEVKPWKSRYTETNSGTESAAITAVATATVLNGEGSRNGSANPYAEHSTQTPFVGAPSFTSADAETPQSKERGERNELGDNSFSSSENVSSHDLPAPEENWATSDTPPAVSSAPLNDIGNSDIAPGAEPAHSMGAVEDEPQNNDWDEDHPGNQQPII